ncbi:MAG TPA: hypothetical protein VHD58_06295 [Mycobacteriales bacterium]|nr:hypothetical protein [Mycobacteriales bacterium]
MSNGRFQTQSDNPNAWVGVAEGFNHDTQQAVQDFIIQDKETQQRIHLGIDMNGNEVFRTPWH